jgi:hypothetical protein
VAALDSQVIALKGSSGKGSRRSCLAGRCRGASRRLSLPSALTIACDSTAAMKCQTGLMARPSMKLVHGATIGYSLFS